VVAGVSRVPGLAGHGQQIASAVKSGQIGHVIAGLPATAARSVGMITRAAFTAGLNHILLVAAIIALASGVVSLLSIRGRDFAHQGAPGAAEAPGPPEVSGVSGHR